MANTVKDLRFSIYINNSSARNSLIEMEKATDSLKTQMGALVDAGKKDTDEYRKLKSAFDDNQKSMTAMKKDAGLLSLSMKDLKQQAGYLRSSLNNAVPGTEKYKAIEKELIVVERRMNDLKEASIDARKGTESFAGKMSGMPGIVGTVGQSLQGLGMMLKTVFANPAMIALTAIVGLAAGLWSVAKYSMEFGKAVSSLSAITGATGKDLDFLKDKAKELAKQYGQSAVEIVDAMKLVGSAKPELLSNVQALSEVTASVLTLSKATGMELSESTKAVTTIMNQFGLSALESDRTINVLAAGSKFGAVEVDYLGDSISKVGTVAKSAGLSLEQTTAVMELFGEKGVKAETAGNGFKRVLVELQSDTKNYTNGVFDLNKAIDNNQKIAGDNIALQKKFGTEYFGLAQILLQNRDRFEELTTQVTGTTTAEEQMRIATDNLSGDMDKMGSSWNAFILSLEDGQGPISNTFRALIQWATDAVDSLGLLMKSTSQKTNDNRNSNTEGFVKATKDVMSSKTDKVGFITSVITDKQREYIENQNKIKKLEDEISVNNKKNFFMYSTELDTQNKKQIAQLKESIIQSKMDVNALGGLRAALKKEASKTTVPGGDKSGGDTETEKDRKKRESAEKKSEQDRLKKIEEDYKKEIDIKQKAYNVDLLTLMEQRRKGEITEDRLNQKSLALNIKFLENKKAINLKYYKDASEIDLEISKQRLKSQEDADAEIIKTAKDLQDSGIQVLDSANQTKQSMLQDALNKQVITEKEYNSEIKKLAVELLAAKVALAEASLRALESANFSDGKVKENAIAKAKAELVSLKGALVKAEGDVAKDTAKTVEKETLTIAERMEGIFGKSFSNISNLFSTFSKNFLDESGNLTTKNLKTFKDWANAIGGTIQSALGVAQQVSDEYFASQAAGIEADKQKELSANEEKFKQGIITKEEYEKQKEDLDQKYAQKELDLKKEQSSADTKLKIAQAVAAGGLAIVQAYAQLGPIGGTIAALMIAGITKLQIDTITKQNAAIQATTLDSSTTGGDASQPTTGARVVTPQAADGRYDVLGAQDGRTYRNVRYAGVARTGMVHTPTLYGEAGTELVISAPDLRRLNMKAPGFNNFVLNNRVNQRADGNYASLQNGGSDRAADNSTLIAANMETMNRVANLLEWLTNNRIEAYTLLNDFEKKRDLRDKSLKKGSI